MVTSLIAFFSVFGGKGMLANKWRFFVSFMMNQGGTAERSWEKSNDLIDQAIKLHDNHRFLTEQHV